MALSFFALSVTLLAEQKSPVRIQMRCIGGAIYLSSINCALSVKPTKISSMQIDNPTHSHTDNTVTIFF